MKLIGRRQYLEKLVNVTGTRDIKVITDVRRSGRSKLLEAFEEYVRTTVSTRIFTVERIYIQVENML